MKRFMLKISAAITATFIYPALALADTQFGTPGLKNPIKIGSIRELLNAFLDIVIFLGTYVAVIFLLWSGFLFVKAQGNPGELETAKKTFFYTIIGVAILLGAKALSEALEATITTIVK